MNKNITSLAKVFKALSDENRIKILWFIHKKQCRCKGDQCEYRDETCIKDLSRLLNITIPTISHHIKELINANLITTKKEGRWLYCKINHKAFEKTCSFLSRLSNNKLKL